MAIDARLAVEPAGMLPLRALLQACYDLQAEGVAPTSEPDAPAGGPALRGLATDLVASSTLSRPDPAPLSEEVRPAPWEVRLEQLLGALDARARQTRLEETQTSPRCR